MCSLAATGFDGRLAVALVAAALVALVTGVLLVRRSRAAATALLLVLVVAAAFAAPAPAATAACPPGLTAPAVPPPPPAPPLATIGLVATSQVFGFTGATTRPVDVVNLSSTTTALGVSLIGIPVGWTVDASGCAAIPPGGSCVILVAIPGDASIGVWPYTVAGSNTNAVADSMSLLAFTTLSLSPGDATFAAPGAQTPFTVTNTGTVDAVLVTTVFTGTDPSAYVVGASTCPATLAPGTACTVTVESLGATGTGDAVLEVSAVNTAVVAAPLFS